MRAVFCTLLMCLLMATASSAPASQLELDLLKNKVALLKDKLELLELKKSAHTESTKDISTNSSMLEVSSLIQNATQSILMYRTRLYRAYDQMISKAVRRSSPNGYVFQESLAPISERLILSYDRIRDDGEETSVEETTSEEIINFFFMHVRTYSAGLGEASEVPQGSQKNGRKSDKGSIDNSKKFNQVIVSLLGDNTIGVSSLSGEPILRAPITVNGMAIDLASPGDKVVDFVAPPSPDDPFFALLTQKGFILVYHYDLIESQADYQQHLFERYWKTRANEIKASGEKYNDKSLKQMKDSIRHKARQDSSQFAGLHLYISAVETLNLKDVLKTNSVNLGDQIVGHFDAETIQFNTIELAIVRMQKLFVISDSMGYVMTLARNLRFKQRFYSDSSVVKQIGFANGTLGLLQPDAIAFANVLDGSLAPSFCENGIKSQLENGEELHSFAVETFRTNAPHIYALTSKAEIVVFKTNQTAGSAKRDMNECALKSRIRLPSDFVRHEDLSRDAGSTLSMTALKGSLLIQSSRGEIMILDTSLGSLFQTPIFQVYTPTFALAASEEKQKVITDPKVREARLVGGSGNARTKGSWAAVRVPHQSDQASTQIAIVEYNNSQAVPSSEHDESLKNDWGAGSSALVFFGFFSIFAYGIARKNAEKSGRKGGNSSRGASSGGAFGRSGRASSKRR